MLLRDGNASCTCCGSVDCIRQQFSQRIYQGTWPIFGLPAFGNVIVPLDYCCNLALREYTGSFVYNADWGGPQTCNGGNTSTTYRAAYTSTGTMFKVWHPPSGRYCFYWRVQFVGSLNECGFPFKTINYTQDYPVGAGCPQGCNPLFRQWAYAPNDPNHPGFPLEFTPAGSGSYVVDEQLSKYGYSANVAVSYVVTATGWSGTSSMNMTVNVDDPCLEVNDCPFPGGPGGDSGGGRIDSILRILGIRVPPPAGGLPS